MAVEVKLCIDYSSDSPVKVGWFGMTQSQAQLWQPETWTGYGSFSMMQRMAPDESQTNPLFEYKHLDKQCPEDEPPYYSIAGQCPDDGKWYTLNCRMEGSCSCGKIYNWVYKGAPYAAGNTQYSHLTLQDGVIVQPEIYPRCYEGGGYSSSSSIFPTTYLMSVITSGGEEALIVNTLLQYSAMSPQDWFEPEHWSFIERICDGGAPSWANYYWPTDVAVQTESVHWLSNTKEIQEGKFALNAKNTCNGRVDFITDEDSHFLSGTYIYNVKSWLNSDTVEGPLVDGGVKYLNILNIGDVANSKILSESTVEANPFIIDFAGLQVEASKITGAENKTFEEDLVETTFFYQEVEGVVVDTVRADEDHPAKGRLYTSCITVNDDFSCHNLNMENSAIVFTEAKAKNLEFKSCDTEVILMNNVDLTLINYLADSLKFSTSGSELINLEMYIGFTEAFEDFSLELYVDLGSTTNVLYKISMVNVSFITQPSKIILVGATVDDYIPTGVDGWYEGQAIKYIVDKVVFDAAGGDPRQVWDGTEVTYTLSLGDFAIKDLKTYGIPTSSIKQTRVSTEGTRPLFERIEKEIDRTKLFTAASPDNSSYNNEAQDMKYNVVDTTVDDLILPRCDK